jgi:fluoroquinolone transport system permease protein
MNSYLALTRTDLRNVWRDAFLKYMLVYPFVLGPALRFLIPRFTSGMAEVIDLTAYYPLLVALFGLILPPVLTGVTVGFLLLDERDARTLVALQVTPFTLIHYLAYRLLLPFAVGLLAAYALPPLLNLLPFRPLATFPLILTSALAGPLYTLLLASFANNKVQGLAVMKGLGFFVIAPVAAWFVPEPWQYLLGVVPTYWPVKAFWVMYSGGNSWLPLLIGALWHIVALWLALHLFRRSMMRMNG